MYYYFPHTIFHSFLEKDSKFELMRQVFLTIFKSCIQTSRFTLLSLNVKNRLEFPRLNFCKIMKIQPKILIMV